MQITYPKHLLALAPMALLAPQPVLAAGSLVQLDRFTGPASSSEIIAFDAGSRLLYNTYGSVGNAGIQIVDASNPTALSSLGEIDMSSFGGQSVKSISAVAADPLGRGFGVATFIPENSGSNPGRVVFFDPETKSVLHSVEVGYHPDMVRFSADGSKIYVANEGEPLSEGTAPNLTHLDSPGSISIIDVSAVASKSDVTGLGGGQVGTYDFSGVDLSGVRVHPSNNPDLTPGAFRFNDIEPEYITELGNKLYVSLQENNAVGEFDIASRTWTKVTSLGTIAQTIDASDRDGGIHIDDVVRGMPMPDGIASYSANGLNLVVTANEGDGRPPDFALDGHPVSLRDDPRVSDLTLDAGFKAQLDTLYGGANSTANSRLGRLRVSRFDSDTDGDGDADQLLMFGTRSFSIWDADSGSLVWDSGSFFETLTSIEVPDLFNSEGTEDTLDGRSPNKGPEPEGITLGDVNGKTWAFVGLERVGGVMVFDISDPFHPDFIDYINTGEIAPEGLTFVPAADSPTGVPLLYVGYEVSSQIGVYAVVVPETGHLAPWLVAFGLGAFGWHRRQRRIS
ncbi:MAG: choice-of-anchor I family protein [Limisphaerales bacterium]